MIAEANKKLIEKGCQLEKQSLESRPVKNN